MTRQTSFLKCNLPQVKAKLHLKKDYHSRIDFCLQNFFESEDKVIVNHKSMRTKADSIATSEDAVEEEFNDRVVLDNLTSEWRIAEDTSNSKTTASDTGDKLQNKTNVQVYCQT